MGAMLTISDDDTIQMASRLAQITGESVEQVMIRALRTELERQDKARDREARRQRILHLAGEIRANIEPGTTSDHGWLYDGTGLPR